MTTTTTKPTITVKYWRGTTQHEEKAKNYQQAMRIASRNQNASQPTYWTEAGEQLHDDGNGLATEADMEAGRYSL